MLTFLRRLRTPCARKSLHHHSYVELLQPRAMLSGTTAEAVPETEALPPEMDPTDPGAELPGVENLAPMIEFIMTATGPGQTVDITGSVTDDVDPTGLVVTFSGVVTGSATVDSTGAFNLTTVATALGTATASVTDAGGLDADVDALLDDLMPMIDGLTVTQLNATDWQVSGQVTDEFPGGLTVYFGGILPSGLSATVDTDGSFKLTFTWTSPTSGFATATLDDWWGQSSPVAQEYVFV